MISSNIVYKHVLCPLTSRMATAFLLGGQTTVTRVGHTVAAHTRDFSGTALPLSPPASIFKGAIVTFRAAAPVQRAAGMLRMPHASSACQLARQHSAS